MSTDKVSLTVQVVPGYESLASVLFRALDQAQDGKGRERHADGLPYEHQPILQIERMIGGGFCCGQAIKKIIESNRLPADRARAELLGAINYIAGRIIALERGDLEHGGPEAVSMGFPEGFTLED